MRHDNFREQLRKITDAHVGIFKGSGVQDVIAMATQTDAVTLNDLDRGTDADEDLLWALMDVDGIQHGHVSYGGTPTVFPEDNTLHEEAVKIGEDRGYEVTVTFLDVNRQLAIRFNK